MLSTIKERCTDENRSEINSQMYTPGRLSGRSYIVPNKYRPRETKLISNIKRHESIPEDYNDDDAYSSSYSNSVKQGFNLYCQDKMIRDIDSTTQGNHGKMFQTNEDFEGDFSVGDECRPNEYRNMVTCTESSHHLDGNSTLKSLTFDKQGYMIQSNQEFKRQHL